MRGEGWAEECERKSRGMKGDEDASISLLLVTGGSERGLSSVSLCSNCVESTQEREKGLKELSSDQRQRREGEGVSVDAKGKRTGSKLGRPISQKLYRRGICHTREERVSERERGRSKTRSKKTKYDASVSSRRDVVHIPSSTRLLEFTFEGYIFSEVT